jgi:RNA polymerase sigma-70 factor (ECF subfamily)
MAAPTRPEFTELVARFGRELYVFLWRMLSNEQDAEDCLQEAFLRAYRAYPRMQGEVNFRAWLYRIAGNTARTQLKRRLRRDGREIDLPDEESAASHRSGQADDGLELRDRLAAVRAAVRGLPFKQQQSLILRKYQGLSYAEIGAALDCSPESARANVYQALRRLRSELAVERQG